jgi:hypothetical protein
VNRLLLSVALISAVAGLVSTALADDALPKVRDERPRIFWRAKSWDGPSIERVKAWMKTDEYKLREVKIRRDQAGPISWAVVYLAEGDAAFGKKAVEGLKSFKIAGDSYSYQGIEAEKCAALYDWLHDHPDFDADNRGCACC